MTSSHSQWHYPHGNRDTHPITTAVAQHNSVNSCCSACGINQNNHRRYEFNKVQQRYSKQDDNDDDQQDDDPEEFDQSI
jgi:hypothetical protein